MTTTELTVSMRETWALLFPEVDAPLDSQWAIWLLLHDPGTVKKGIAELAAKYRRLQGQMGSDYMLKFASSVMNRITREQKEEQKQ